MSQISMLRAQSSDGRLEPVALSEISEHTLLSNMNDVYSGFYHIYSFCLHDCDFVIYQCLVHVSYKINHNCVQVGQA